MNEESNVELPLSSRLGVVGVVDTAIYRAEIVIVVTALVLMSIIVFGDVVYQLAVGIAQDLEAGSGKGYTVLVPILGFVGLIAFAATGDNRVHDDETTEARTSRPLAVRIGVTVAVVLGCLAAGWAMLTLESSTVYRAVLVALAAPIVLVLRRQGDNRRLAFFVVSAVLAFLVFGWLPTGYSWSQSYSLIMLLWVGFLGGSIAARQRRHLRVDLARKLLPPQKLPAFNAVSYLFAASFTAVILYLSVEYMIGHDSTYLRPIWEAPAWLPASAQQMLTAEFPLPEDASLLRRTFHLFFVPSEPGELPDWLKVAAIPVSMFLIAARFLGHSVVFAGMAMRGEEFREQTGSH